MTQNKNKKIKYKKKNVRNAKLHNLFQNLQYIYIQKMVIVLIVNLVLD